MAIEVALPVSSLAEGLLRASRKDNIQERLHKNCIYYIRREANKKTERVKKVGFMKDFFGLDLVGAVTILTDDRVIFQGQIVKNDEKRHHDEDCPKIEVKAKLDDDPDFVVLRLTCDPAVIDDDGDIEEIEPDLFEEGDIIRINVNEIIAVGPSRCCLGEDKKPSDKKTDNNG